MENGAERKSKPKIVTIAENQSKIPSYNLHVKMSPSRYRTRLQ